MPFPHPNCAKCKKPVDKVEWYDDLFRRAYSIRVFCHGETECFVVDEWFFVLSGNPGDYSIKEVFTQESISGPVLVERLGVK